MSLVRGMAYASNVATGTQTTPLQRFFTSHLGSLACGLVLLVALFTALSIGAKTFPGLLMGADQRLSTSKSIALAWTVIVGWFLTTTVIVVLASGGQFGQKLQPLSETYYLLLGGPFAALVLAKGITATRTANGTLIKSSGSGGIKPGDLINNDSGTPDLPDFQFALFNLVVLAYVLVEFILHTDRGLPVIPNALAALTSVSALAYTTNKAMVNNAPVINSATVDGPAGLKVLTIKGANLGGVTTDVVLDGTNLSVSPDSTATILYAAIPDALATGKRTLTVSVTEGQATLSAIKTPFL